MPDDKQLPANIGTKSAAHLLGVDQRTVLRWADAGRFGRVSRIDMGDNRPGMLQLNRKRVERIAAELKAEQYGVVSA